MTERRGAPRTPHHTSMTHTINGFAIAAEQNGTTIYWHRLSADLRSTLWESHAEAQRQLEMRQRDDVLWHYRDMRVVVGHRENVFHCLQRVDFYEHWIDAFNIIAEGVANCAESKRLAAGLIQ
jgi:hypothetical protein